MKSSQFLCYSSPLFLCYITETISVILSESSSKHSIILKLGNNIEQLIDLLQKLSIKFYFTIEFSSGFQITDDQSTAYSFFSRVIKILIKLLLSVNRI